MQMCEHVILLLPESHGTRMLFFSTSETNDPTSDRFTGISIHLTLISTLSQIIAEFGDDQSSIEDRIRSRQ